MKKIAALLISAVFLFAAQYSIIAFSTVKFNKKAAEEFIKRFPNGVVKQYTKFVEYKIEPFNSYKDAKKFLSKVKKYYKYPLIIKYNPHLGILLYPSSASEKAVTSDKTKPAKESVHTQKKKDTKGLVFCKNDCGCEKKEHGWELNCTELSKEINVSVKEYLKQNGDTAAVPAAGATGGFADINDTNGTYETNQTYQCRAEMSDYMFYFDIYYNDYYGEANQSYKDRLYGDNGNIKLGFVYEKYFWDYWKFYTDDRIIFSRKNINGSSNTNLYFDINELYLRSFCFNDDLTNILIGRKKTKDYRSWWYDAALDEIKIFSEYYLLNYELIFATRLNDQKYIDDSSPKSALKDSKFVIFHTDYTYEYKSGADFYYIYENSKPKFENALKREIHFAGAGLRGNFEEMFYWINAGISHGDIKNAYGSEKADGYGFDLGVKIAYSSKLSIAGSYAYGEKSFKQPIIATNYSDYLNKNFSFRYYGSIFDPELNNIHILSLYGIYSFDNNKSVIGAFHVYRQDSYENRVYNGKYFYPTNAQSKDLGKEADLIYQYLAAREEKLKVGIGLFLGDKAFDGLKNKNAYRFFINYRHYWK